MLRYCGEEFSSLYDFEDFVKSSVFPCEYETNRERIFYFSDSGLWYVGVHDLTNPRDSKSKPDFFSLGCSIAIDVTDDEDMFSGEFPVRVFDESFRKNMIL